LAWHNIQSPHVILPPVVPREPSAAGQGVFGGIYGVNIWRFVGKSGEGEERYDKENEKGEGGSECEAPSAVYSVLSTKY
jgi:hypothetical protein